MPSVGSIHDRIKLQLEEGMVGNFHKPSLGSSPEETGYQEANIPTVYESINRALDATVLVLSETGLGSGFIIDSHGLMVTCRHVIGDDRATQLYAQVLLHPHRSDSLEVTAKVIRSHRTLDYAILYIGGTDRYPALKRGDPTLLRHTDTVYAVGSPGGMINTVSKGIISNPMSIRAKIEYIQTDASLSPGFSGGPLVNESGEVLGINQGGFPEHPSANFCVPIDYLQADLDMMMHHDKETIMNGYYCPFCGFFSLEHPEWYCTNCGTQQVVTGEDE